MFLPQRRHSSRRERWWTCGVVGASEIRKGRMLESNWNYITLFCRLQSSCLLSLAVPVLNQITTLLVEHIHRRSEARARGALVATVRKQGITDSVVAAALFALDLELTFWRVRIPISVFSRPPASHDRLLRVLHQRGDLPSRKWHRQRLNGRTVPHGLTTPVGRELLHHPQKAHGLRRLRQPAQPGA